MLRIATLVVLLGLGCSPVLAQMPGQLQAPPPVVPPPGPDLKPLPLPPSILPPPGQSTITEPSVHPNPTPRASRRTRSSEPDRSSFSDRVVPCIERARAHSLPDREFNAYVARCANRD